MRNRALISVTCCVQITEWPTTWYDTVITAGILQLKPGMQLKYNEMQ